MHQRQAQGHPCRDQGNESYSATHARHFPGLTLSKSLRRSRVAFTADSMLDSTVSPSSSFGSCSKYPTCRSDREWPTIVSPQVTRVRKDCGFQQACYRLSQSAPRSPCRRQVEISGRRTLANRNHASHTNALLREPRHHPARTTMLAPDR